MDGSVLLLCLLGIAGVVVLTPLSSVIAIPQPVLLTLFGIGLSLLPWVPTVSVPPELILPVALPPLLFAATLRTSPREFRTAAAPVLLLAVGLTVVTAAAVAAVAHGSGLSWPEAWVLGAVVSPPDPVAATSVARRLQLPARVVTVLEGEGLFNDATALVLFKVALAAAVSGDFSTGDTFATLALALAVGIAAGGAAGWMAQRLLAAIHDAATETTITLAVPFAAYLGAEQLGGSGVLAVLVCGLYLRSGAAHAALTSRGWLDGRAVWRYLDFALTSAAFTLLGIELVDVISRLGMNAASVRQTAGTVVTVVAVRALWVYPAAAALSGRTSSTRWRESTVVAWAGMRGVVTVATALSLPPDVGPDRQAMVLVALTVVLTTLVVQGLTLTPVVRLLRVRTSDDPEAAVSGPQAALRPGGSSGGAPGGGGDREQQGGCDGEVRRHDPRTLPSRAAPR